MDIQLAREIIACLPRGRTLFRYYPGRFAFLLLAFVAERYSTVAEIKGSSFARLLQREDVKQFLSACGHGKLCRDQLQQAWHEPSYCFRLSLSGWVGKPGLWDQMSRRGVNLVLQLNFSNEHNAAYRKLYQPTEDNAFNYVGHPVAWQTRRRVGAETLAWSRIDLDFDTGEALIEELQSDWVRLTAKELAYVKWCDRKGYKPRPYLARGVPKRRREYLEEVITPYQKIWSEVMLAATVWFIREELGLKRIFMHTADSGGKVKRISGNQPPRSLYSDLPRRFCFAKTREAPEFLQQLTPYRRLAKKVDIQWQALAC